MEGAFAPPPLGGPVVREHPPLATSGRGTTRRVCEGKPHSPVSEAVRLVCRVACRDSDRMKADVRLLMDGEVQVSEEILNL